MRWDPWRPVKTLAKVAVLAAAAMAAAWHWTHEPAEL